MADLSTPDPRGRVEAGATPAEGAAQVIQGQETSPAANRLRRFGRRAAVRALGLTLFGGLAGWSIGYAMGRSAGSERLVEAEVTLPSQHALPFEWGDVGVLLAREGAIDRDRMLTRFSGSPALPYLTAVLDGRPGSGPQQIVTENAIVLLDLLWAFGLANRNAVLLSGPIQEARTPIGNLASTGGWTLARGGGASHFAAHDLVTLDPTQQARVESLAKGIYRPCCDNPTSFPDCNHGMAMLGLLELMAVRGTGEKEMAQAALGANTLWFTQEYWNLARLFALQGKRWEEADPLEVLGRKYSSASGVRQWMATLPPAPGAQPGGGCAA